MVNLSAINMKAEIPTYEEKSLREKVSYAAKNIVHTKWFYNIVQDYSYSPPSTKRQHHIDDATLNKHHIKVHTLTFTVRMLLCILSHYY